VASALRGSVQRYDRELQRWITIRVYWRDLGYAVRDGRAYVDAAYATAAAFHVARTNG
jgi:hypothetical protein